EKMASKVSVGLRSVKSIVVRFCPFEPNVESTRKFLQCIYHKKVQATNTNCEVTADVNCVFGFICTKLHTRVVVTFLRFSSFIADGDRLIMKGAHLTTGEMLTALASRCNAKDLKEEQKNKKKNN
ncbi:RM53 protein, partial [Panurus biarmicus]|nr:RM53 protein [Panurus biarmicus]